MTATAGCSPTSGCLTARISVTSCSPAVAKVYVYNQHPFQRVPAYRAAEAIGRRRSTSVWRCGATTAVLPLVPPTDPRSNCDPSYPDVCIPPYSKVGDLDCGDVPFKNIRIVGS